MEASQILNTLIIDVGIIGTLLLVGVVLRAYLRPLQWLLLPAPVIAGMLGFLLGPNMAGILPLSPMIGSYTTMLIAAVFASMAIAQDFTFSKISSEVRAFTGYGITMSAGQVLVGMLLALLVLDPLFDSPNFMGLILFAAWSGGFGTSAAMGDVFASQGQAEVTSVAFSAATVGMLSGIIGGVILSRYGHSRGYAKALKSSTTALPRSMRRGILERDERSAYATHTMSGSSMETLGLHLALIGAIVGVGGVVQNLSAERLNNFALPLFATAFLVGLIARFILRRTNAMTVVDRGTTKAISGTASDILIVCGIASIEPRFVSAHLPALIAIFVLGIVFCLVLGVFVAPRYLGDSWFEKQIFTWGWATGSVATGIALLRIVDPDLESGTVDEFGYAYIPLIPIEGAAVAVAPLIILAGLPWLVAIIWGLVAFVGVWLMVSAQKPGAA